MLNVSSLNWLVRLFSKRNETTVENSFFDKADVAGQHSEVPSAKIDVKFNFCFFEFGRPPKLIETKTSNFSFSREELYTLIVSSSHDFNSHKAINIVSDYMMAIKLKESDKRLMMEMRDAGTNPLLAALLFDYGSKIIELIKEQERLYGALDKVSVFFMIRAGSQDIRSFANTCFSVQIIPCSQRDQIKELKLRESIEAFLSSVT